MNGGEYVNMMPRYRVNRVALTRYMNFELAQKSMSERQLAKQIGISHTLLQQIRTGRAKGAPKNHVNYETARRIEDTFGVPQGILFFPEMSSVTGNTGTAA